MVYTSTYYTEMLHFTMTVDDITVDAVYRAFMEPRYSYFAIWTLDHRTGRASFVSVRREHFVSFAWHLRNRSSESTYHASIFWDVISQDLSMTNFIQTEPTPAGAPATTTDASAPATSTGTGVPTTTIGAATAATTSSRAGCAL